MTKEVERNYLEIHSINDLKEGIYPSDNYILILLDPINFQLNKFFYKNIGKKHKWVDRLIWDEQRWIDSPRDGFDVQLRIQHIPQSNAKSP